MRTFLVSASFVGNFQDNRIIGLGFWSHKDCASIHDSRLCPYQDAVTIINPVHRHQPRGTVSGWNLRILESVLKSLGALLGQTTQKGENYERDGGGSQGPDHRIPVGCCEALVDLEDVKTAKGRENRPKEQRRGEKKQRFFFCRKLSARRMDFSSSRDCQEGGYQTDTAGDPRRYQTHNIFHRSIISRIGERKR